MSNEQQPRVAAAARNPEAGLLQKAWALVKEIGSDLAVTGAASIRQTGNEISQFVLPAFPQAAHALPEPGMPGVPTPQQVTDQIYGRQPHAEKPAPKAAEPEKQGRDREIEV
jgi:hypothetical protein